MLVTDAFPPMRSSGAVQVRDLSLELARQGHEVSVVAPSPDLKANVRVESFGNVRVIRSTHRRSGCQLCSTNYR